MNSNVSTLIVKQSQKITLYGNGKGLALKLVITMDEDKQLFVCKSLDNPVSKTRTTCIVRGTQANTVFTMKMSILEV